MIHPRIELKLNHCSAFIVIVYKRCCEGYWQHITIHCISVGRIFVLYFEYKILYIDGQNITTITDIIPVSCKFSFYNIQLCC